MKKLINKAEDVVKESIAGVAAAHGDLVKVYFDPNFIVRADAPVKGKVALVSGGGSGHEPMHGGLVGKGMLDAAKTLAMTAIDLLANPEIIARVKEEFEQGK